MVQGGWDIESKEGKFVYTAKGRQVEEKERGKLVLIDF